MYSDKVYYFAGLICVSLCLFGGKAWAFSANSCANTAFIPVTQCFTNTGATGWILQRYSNNSPISTVPLTAASNIDAAGSGWLRLTDNTGNQSGSAYYNLPINVTQLGLQAQFNYTAWGGSGADGISFYLFDGATTNTNFVQGVFGGGLGYCQQTNYGGTTLNGLSNAVLGVGIDDYGNFGNNHDRCPNYGENGRTNLGSSYSYGTIVLRGPGNGQQGYNWMADTYSKATPNITPTWYTTATSVRPTSSQFYRNVLINLAPTTVGGSVYNVTTAWQTAPNGAFTTLMTAPYPSGNTVPLNSTSNGQVFTLPTTTGDTWNPLPPTVKFGFGASTGGATNYHEIQNAFFTEGLPDLAITQNTASASGGNGIFFVTVTNMGSSAASNPSISITLNGLANVLWSCTPSGGSTCPLSGSGAPTNVSFSLGLVGSVSFTIKGQAAVGSKISDSVVVSGGTGFSDMCTDNNTSSTSLTIGSAGVSHLNLSQLPQTSDSTATNTLSGGQVQTKDQVYISKYHPANWWGELLAYNFLFSGTGSSATITGISSSAVWDASCNLTGGSCPLVTGAPTITAISPTSRSLLSWNGTQGVPLTWNTSTSGTTLTAAQQSSLTADPVLTGTKLTGSDVINYLRGVRTAEQSASTPGPFRTRTGILGDIVNSNPVWVGPPNANYPTSALWQDLLYPKATMPENTSSGSTTTNSYLSFQSSQSSRTNVTYVGSNDGFVHGFSAGHYSSGSFVSTGTDNSGAELIAYMPSTILANIATNTAPSSATVTTNYNFTDPAYTHRFFVNATPTNGDLFYNSAWHSWLVGGLGGGGQAIYALDVTNPTNFSQGNAASLVVKELNTSNLSCVNVSNCANDLGWTYGSPIIQRMHNGNWAVIFGNGYDSTNESAAVFVAVISSSGVWSVYELTTNQQTPNGISYVTGADLDADAVVDYLYAGDLFGNVWRFDVTSSNPLNWQASSYGASSAQPLFTALNENGLNQPITTAIQVLNTLQYGLSRIVIAFGTGKNLEAADQLPDNTSNGVQSIYGIWDYDMTNWNKISSKNYASQIAPQPSSSQSINRTVLQQQSVIGTYDSNGNACTPSSTTTCNYRTLSGYKVCWLGTTACSRGNDQFGYYLDLPALAEQIIYNPIQINGIFIATTTIPSSTTQGLTCYPGLPPGGWTMAINPLNGGALGGSFFPNSSGSFVSINGQMVSGKYLNALGSPNQLSYNNLNYLLENTPNTPVVTQINLGAGTTPGSGNAGTGQRVNWIQLR